MLAAVGVVIGWLAVTFDEAAYRMARLGAGAMVELPIPPPPAAPEPAPPESTAREPPEPARPAGPPAPEPEAVPDVAALPEREADAPAPPETAEAAPPPPPQIEPPAAPPPEPAQAAPADAPAPAAPPPPEPETRELALAPSLPEPPRMPAVEAAPREPVAQQLAPPEPAPPEPAPEPAPAEAAAEAPAEAPAEERVALAAVPDPALVVQTPKGPLPVIAPDGRQAWRVYRRPFDESRDRPRIAIVVAGMGLSRSATNVAIQQLPSSVSLAFAPYASDLEAWIEAARAAGHEVMLQLPMEPFDYPVNDPGPHTLLTSLSVEDNIDRLEWLLGRFTGYIGVTNYMGSRFTSSPDHVRPILSVLRERGLMFLDSRSSRNSVAGKIADDIGLPRALNNRFIDNVASRPAIDARLVDLERIALSTGYAIGIGFPYPVTIERVAAWAATLEGKDLLLTPVSAIVDKQPAS